MGDEGYECADVPPEFFPTASSCLLFSLLWVASMPFTEELPAGTGRVTRFASSHYPGSGLRLPSALQDGPALGAVLLLASLLLQIPSDTLYLGS